MGLLKSEKMGDYEKEQGCASYRTLIEYFVGDIVLCNNIAKIDETIYENMNGNAFYYIDNEGNYRTLEEYNNDTTGDIYEESADIYQYFLCNVSGLDLQFLEKAGVIMSYSDKLDCDVLCVDHLGTSWDYVLTDVKLFDTYEELKAYEDGANNEN